MKHNFSSHALLPLLPVLLAAFSHSRLAAAAPALLSRVAAVPAALFHLATSVLSRLAAAPLAFGLRTLRLHFRHNASFFPLLSRWPST